MQDFVDGGFEKLVAGILGLQRWPGAGGTVTCELSVNFETVLVHKMSIKRRFNNVYKIPGVGNGDK